ncbi:hypothetical protein OG302_22415 [Streptomyces sp. NBC_01283]|uniref:hypothetical protein n=1 Tax=Streptomyces sp. NBC_01283 TaxID=2903812 RepID=UPI00352C28F9|nr:hypothetical protein OG302_22415 [Streptomyces sp. NBC_01283]
MSNHEIQLLALGVGIGMQLMLLVQITFAVLDDRRARKTLRAHEAELEAAQKRANA